MSSTPPARATCSSSDTHHRPPLRVAQGVAPRGVAPFVLEAAMSLEIALPNSSCPVCKQIVGSPPGSPVTPHQKPGSSREQCPGGLGQ